MNLDIIGLLNYLGFTHQRILPLILLVGAVVYIVYKFTDPLKKSITRITNACIEIQTIMASGGASLRHHLVESPGSPLQPTELGKEWIISSGLEKVLNEQKTILKEKLAEKLASGSAEYDVQEKARELLIELKSDPMMETIKKYAYDNGINIDLILKAGGLWLRDDYLGIERKWLKDQVK